MTGPADRHAACAAALAALPGMTPARLASVLRGRTPAEAWDRVEHGWVPAELRPGGGADGLARRWRERAAAVPPEELTARWRDAGVSVVWPGDGGLAARLAGLTPPVSVLFAAGDPTALGWPGVALVGTRRATALGRDVARTFGGDLAAAGVSVVSGLALGVDAAAHAGALAVAGAPPVAVVGTGVDVPYPRGNAALWARVVERGLVLSEHPPGTSALPHHFPQRNRVLAALSQLVVVVESHRVGGALITAELAMDLGRGVGAVPGSLRNPAAEGTNALLRDGVVPIVDAVDILVAAGLQAARQPSVRPRVEPGEQLLLDVLGEGGTVDELVARSGAPLAAVVTALDRLDERGLVAPEGAVWRSTLRSARP